METLKTFKSKNWTARNYECTNVVACQAVAAPEGKIAIHGENWVECDESALAGLTQLEICAGVRYFGYL